MKKILFISVLLMSVAVMSVNAQTKKKSTASNKSKTSSTQICADGLSPKATALLSDLVLLNRPLTMEDMSLMKKYEMELVNGAVCVPLAVKLKDTIDVKKLVNLGMPVSRFSGQYVLVEVPVGTYVSFVQMGVTDEVKLKSEANQHLLSSMQDAHADTTAIAKVPTTARDGAYERMIGLIKDYYNPEQGFFQKAYTDEDDPHFMIEDKKDNFKFGIGGNIHFAMFYDYCGSVPTGEFTTSDIPIPTEYSNQFGLTAGSTKLNFRAIGKVGGKALLGFFEFGVGATGKNITMRHAYVSYAGFTVGHTWSRFMDLAAGCRTVDLEGPNMQISVRHPLIAYTYNFGQNRYELSASVEMPALSYLFNFQNKVVDEQFQPLPDFALHFKYKSDLGHVQVGAIFRDLAFSSNLDTTLVSVDRPRITYNRFGWGVSLSGSVFMGKRCIFSGQAVIGQGIASYIQDFDAVKIDFVETYNVNSEAVDLVATPMTGFYAALQVLWTKRLNSSFIYGHTRVLPIANVQYGKDNDFQYATHYAAVNLFWDINNDLSIGGEFLFGMNVHKVKETGEKIGGMANRFNFMVNYSF